MFRHIQVQFEPIDAWPGAATRHRRRSSFRASLSDTYRLLEYELSKLGCKRLVIQANCERHMIRQDGMLRSNAVLRGPGVILSFDSKHGPLRYPCDTYQHWDCNLRAIALALQALRAVDRYGVTRRAEQYQGWASLPAPSDASSLKTVADALAFLYELMGREAHLGDRPSRIETLRKAEMKTHPDRGGDAEDFKKVQEARRLLLQ